MGIAENPWQMRFRGLNALDSIRARVEVRPDVIDGLEKESGGVVEVEVGMALSRIYRPSAQELWILQYLLERSMGHAKLAYPDREKFAGRLYSPVYDTVSSSPTVCLLGPAGVGKSQLAKAFLRLMPDDCTIDVDHHKNIPLQGAWLVTANPHESVIQSLIPFLGQKKADMCKAGHAGVLKAATAIAYRNGLSHILVDEMQFMVGSDRTTRITKTLLDLRQLGVPFVYVANYSLWRSLSKRHAQIVQRLLANPLQLRPDPPDSEDWTGYLMECSRVLGSYLDEDLALKATPIFDMTAGLKRFVVLLLQGAFRIAWSQRKRQVAWPHIIASYHSPQYCISREQVEMALNKYEKSKRQIDYESPVAMSGEQTRGVEDAKAKYTERIMATRALASAVPIGGQCASPEIDLQTSPQRVPRPKVPPRTVHSLIDSASRLRRRT